MVSVSIIVPVYNAESYLEKCVDSLLKQSMRDIEIILINDGSTDSSGYLCDKYKKNTDRITVIHQENQGVSVARNAGLAVASGEWITFVDSDDWVDHSLCSKAVKFGEDNDAEVVIFHYWTAYSDKHTKSRFISFEQGEITDHKNLLLKKTISQYYGGNIDNSGVSAGTTWGKLIKRKILTENRIQFQPGLVRAQDTIFWLSCFNVSNKIFMLNEALYYYRISNTSVCSGTRFIPDCEVPFTRLLDAYASFIKESYINDDFTEALNLRVMQILSWHLKHKTFHELYPKTRRKKIQEMKKLVNSMPYYDAIKNVKLKWLPRSLKLMTICCRFHLYYSYYAIHQIIKYIRYG